MKKENQKNIQNKKPKIQWNFEIETEAANKARALAKFLEVEVGDYVAYLIYDDYEKKRKGVEDIKC